MQNALEIVENRKYSSSCSLCQPDVCCKYFFFFHFHYYLEKQSNRKYNNTEICLSTNKQIKKQNNRIT